LQETICANYVRAIYHHMSLIYSEKDYVYRVLKLKLKLKLN